MKKNITFAILGALIAIVGLVTARVVLYPKPEEHPHFHANFAIYLNGKKLDLSGDKYMTDVAACTTSTALTPIERAHMHNRQGDVVHVHAEAVTWGHFLTNIGLGVGDTFLEDDKNTMYQNTQDQKLHFILNGDDTTSIVNRPIKSEDRLLISYGNDQVSDLINNRYKEVPNTAKELNAKHDPSSCGGGEEETPSFLEKVKRSFIW